MKKGVPFTSSSAPRSGRVKGSRNKLSAQSLQILDRLLADWTKHGAAVLRTLRIEQPSLYAKLALDVASRVTLNDAAIDDGAPSVLIVKWVDPKSPPPLAPPEPIREFSPTAPTSPSPPHDPARATPTPPPMLTLLPRPPA
jgi:hypothetical protein